MGLKFEKLTISILMLMLNTCYVLATLRSNVPIVGGIYSIKVITFDYFVTLLIMILSLTRQMKWGYNDEACKLEY